MGSGDWFKTIISFRKVKVNSSKQVKESSNSDKSNNFKWKNRPQKEPAISANGSTSSNPRALDMPVEDLAAIRIQTAFRAYKARKTMLRLKGVLRLQTLTKSFTVKKQATTTLNYLHSWSKIQAEIRARHICMVIEDQVRRKKLENQLKLEAKLHDLEVEWSGGFKTMEEILARIHHREEAAVKRERAMAYAFSHQWRANSSHNLELVNYELGKANWGWSWKERWIAARPWESRVRGQSISPKKTKNRLAKVGGNINSPTIKTPVPYKPSLSNGKGAMKARRLSYPGADKGTTLEGSIKGEETDTKREQVVS